MLEIKITETEMKDDIDGFIRGLKTSREKIPKLEGILIEAFKTKKQRKLRTIS